MADALFLIERIMKPSPYTAKAFGIPMWLGTKAQFIADVQDVLATWNESSRTHALHTLNPEILMMAKRSKFGYRDLLSRGDWNVVDGVGLQKALERKGAVVPERLCGSDLIYDLAALCQKNNRAVYFIGGAPDRLEKAIHNLSVQYPGLKVGGVSPAPGQALDQLKELPQILNDLKTLRPAVVAVCLGAPRQETWIQLYKDELSAAGVVVAGGLGGTVDFVSGVVPRAPLVFRKLGLEWLYRLAIAPSRFKRQLSALPAFALHALRGKEFEA